MSNTEALNEIGRWIAIFVLAVSLQVLIRKVWIAVSNWLHHRRKA